jgi:hypothetical protein
VCVLGEGAKGDVVKNSCRFWPLAALRALSKPRAGPEPSEFFLSSYFWNFVSGGGEVNSRRSSSLHRESAIKWHYAKRKILNVMQPNYNEANCIRVTQNSVFLFCLSCGVYGATTHTYKTDTDTHTPTGGRYCFSRFLAGRGAEGLRRTRKALSYRFLGGGGHRTGNSGRGGWGVEVFFFSSLAEASQNAFFQVL